MSGLFRRDHDAARASVPETPPIEIGGVPLRARSTVVGEVTSMRLVPHRDTPWLEATISDGTGRLTCVFTGRRSIAGMVVGRRVRAEGTVFEHRQQRYVYNPGFDLLP